MYPLFTNFFGEHRAKPIPPISNSFVADVDAALIRHKDKTWPGQHKAIIDEELWDRVQERLIAASRRKRGEAQSKDGSAKRKDRPF